MSPTAVVFGATGAIGAELWKQLASSGRWCAFACRSLLPHAARASAAAAAAASQPHPPPPQRRGTVTTIGRRAPDDGQPRPAGVKHIKLDLDALGGSPEAAAALAGADAVFCALGTTRGVGAGSHRVAALRFQRGCSCSRLIQRLRPLHRFPNASTNRLQPSITSNPNSLTPDAPRTPGRRQRGGVHKGGPGLRNGGGGSFQEGRQGAVLWAGVGAGGQGGPLGVRPGPLPPAALRSDKGQGARARAAAATITPLASPLKHNQRNPNATQMQPKRNADAAPPTPKRNQAEEAVKAQRFEAVGIFRPGLLDRGERARAGERWFASLVNKVAVADVARVRRGAGLGCGGWGAAVCRFPFPSFAINCTPIPTQHNPNPKPTPNPKP